MRLGSRPRDGPFCRGHAENRDACKLACASSPGLYVPRSVVRCAGLAPQSCVRGTLVALRACDSKRKGLSCVRGHCLGRGHRACAYRRGPCKEGLFTCVTAWDTRVCTAKRATCRLFLVRLLCCTQCSVVCMMMESRFGRIVYINGEDERVHTQWFDHTSNTFLDDIADPREMFLTPLCDTLPLITLCGTVFVANMSGVAAVRDDFDGYFFR
jgi:hypothetical protein